MCEQDTRLWDETDYMKQTELKGVQRFLRQDSLYKKNKIRNINYIV